MHIWDVYVGQIVVFRGSLAKVEKVGRKYPVIVTEDGTRYKVSPSSLSTAPKGSTFTPTVDPANDLVRGSVVRYKHDGKYYVVLGKREGCFSMARLGGDKGRYYTGISPFLLENVEFNLEEAGV